ncbi:hypothetical protein [Rufibacter hautae]|uniref:Outer membrane protein beta-barrel domain-containing protein n=1 Tax=Rufibacter hautae TaxID=2595005 RepID=A0A5B6T9X5_9BACT|nr:hypothetical protein [Rufibacter hautae]KAA3436998.1 hypothetical protein FOA19_21735 [Rufibacter hautae]
MKTVFLFSVLFLIIQVASAQESSKPFFTRVYGTIGVDLVTSENSLANGESRSRSLVFEYKGKLLFSFRKHSFDFNDDTFSPANTTIHYELPQHFVEEMNLSVGKFFQANRAFSFSLSTGPTMVEYRKPYNVKQYIGNNVFGSYDSYTFDMKSYSLWGWDVRGDILFTFSRFVGVSLGGFYSYNKEVPYGGMDVNLMFGVLRSRKEKE